MSEPVIEEVSAEKSSQPKSENAHIIQKLTATNDCEHYKSYKAIKQVYQSGDLATVRTQC